ncbi:MAG: RNA 2'-phosphotransferase, partial [bacterium]|nr:RNA 2'-phosphotransferase [bacterium]
MLEEIEQRHGQCAAGAAFFGTVWGKGKQSGKGKGKKEKKGAEERVLTPTSAAKGRAGRGERLASPGPFANVAHSYVGKGPLVSGAKGTADEGKGQKGASAAKGRAGARPGGKPSEAKGRKGRRDFVPDPRSVQAEGGQFSRFPGGEPEWERLRGTDAEPLLTAGPSKVGGGPVHPRGREVQDLISPEARSVGVLSFPEKLVDPAWAAPGDFPQESPFQEVCPGHLRHAMRVTDLSVPAQLCTSTKVNVHSTLANRASHHAVSLLRHNAHRDGLPIDDGGWALLFHVASRVRVAPGTLIMIAAADDKARFQFAHYAPNGVPSSPVLIRAQQGHPIAH